MDQNDQKSAFEEAGKENHGGLIEEFKVFLLDNKKLWLIPILVVMLMLGAIIVFSGSGAAPFIYTLF